MGTLIVDDTEINVPLPVARSTVARSAEWFTVADRGIGIRRLEAIRAIVLHWNAGVGGAPQIARTLRKRGLAYHLVIEQTGRVVQLADLAHKASHAGHANLWTVGVCLQSIGLAPPHIPDAVVVIETIHGRRRRVMRYPPEQIGATYELLKSLCAVLAIPFVFPVRSDSILRTVMPESLRRGFRGICGHYHLAAHKSDPGVTILEALRARACAPA